jgi:L,D-transpeptidase catalytic domain
LETNGVWSSILPGIKMQLDQSTRRRFIELLGCAAGTALLAACTQKAVMQAVEFKGATAPNAAVTDSVSQQAKVLSTPTDAVERALQISRRPIFPKKDVLAVFDISQPSSKKRFYVLDFESGQVTAHYAAHGRDNGPQAKAIKFKGFQTDLDMVPLGPLKTAHSEVMDPYKTIVDRYDGTVYPNMIVVVLDGVTSYTVTLATHPRTNGLST